MSANKSTFDQKAKKGIRKGNYGHSTGHGKRTGGMSSHKSMENLALLPFARKKDTRTSSNETPKLSKALSMENVGANSPSSSQGMLSLPCGATNLSTMQYGAHKTKADRYRDKRPQSQDEKKGKTKFKATNDDEKNKERGNSSSTQADEPDVSDVFRVLVKEFGGICKPNLLRRKFTQLSPTFDFTSWLEKQEHRFRLLQKENPRGVKVVSFHFAATACLSYCRMNKEKNPCSNETCPHYHICRDYVIGNCSYDRCRYSHDFYDGHNRPLTEKNKLNAFSNADIRVVASFRYPQVCKDYNLTYGCADAFCTKLHLCKNFVLGRCLTGSDCKYEHNFRTDHNRSVILAYRMNQILEKSEFTFRRLIYVWRDPLTEKSSGSAVENRSNAFTDEDDKKTFDNGTDVQTNDYRTILDHNKRSDKGMQLKYDDISRTKDIEKHHGKKDGQQKSPSTQDTGITEADADQTALCDAVLVNKCHRENCCYNRHHCVSLQLPYCWQINLYGSWITLGKKDTLAVEEAFCSLRDTSDKFQVYHDNVEYVGYIKFNATPTANVTEKELGQESMTEAIQVRRLSTRSYVEAEENSHSFLTQWRWYWRKKKEWCLIGLDPLQETLERKYKACQRQYQLMLSGEDRNFRLDFRSMTAAKSDSSGFREIRRRPLYVNSGDVMRQSVPVSLGRKQQNLPPNPASWEPWDLVNPYEFVELEPESEEYESVENSFYKSMDEEQCQVLSISRIQNPTLWRNFIAEEENRASRDSSGKKASMAKRNLFHGTDTIDVVHGISRNGFDDRLAGKNATRYGEGAYFSTRASYSHSYTDADSRGVRYMFRAKVLVGEFCQGKAGFKRPPSKPGNKHELYDSCVDDKTNPLIYVVFECSHSYPEYLIQYKELNKTRKKAMPEERVKMEGVSKAEQEFLNLCLEERRKNTGREPEKKSEKTEIFQGSESEESRQKSGSWRGRGRGRGRGGNYGRKKFKESG